MHAKRDKKSRAGFACIRQ